MKQFGMLVLSVALTGFAAPVMAKESCESLKTKIETKLASKGVKAYTLSMITPDEARGIGTENVNAQGRRIVGSCAGGTQKILYQRTTTAH